MSCEYILCILSLYLMLIYFYVFQYLMNIFCVFCILYFVYLSSYNIFCVFYRVLECHVNIVCVFLSYHIVSCEYLYVYL